MTDTSVPDQPQGQNQAGQPQGDVPRGSGNAFSQQRSAQQPQRAGQQPATATQPLRTNDMGQEYGVSAEDQDEMQRKRVEGARQHEANNQAGNPAGDTVNVDPGFDSVTGARPSFRNPDQQRR